MFDLIVSQKIQQLDPQKFLGLMEFFTDLGDVKTIVSLLALTSVFFWLRNKKREAKILVFSVLISAILGTGLKYLIDRPRPTPDLIYIYATETSPSFPSNHALISLVFFGTLALFIKNKTAKAILCLTIFLVGLSRIYLGVHWTSDVLGGYFLGGLILYIVNRYFLPDNER